MARSGGKDRGIVFKKNTWWGRLYVNGREKWFKADNKTQAKVLYGRLKAEIREGRYFPEKFKPSNDITLRAWLKRCLEGSINRGVANEKRYARRWSLLLGGHLLSEITMDKLRHIQAKFKAKGKWSDATINRHIAFLRHVLMLAVKDGILQRNPVSGLKFFPEPWVTRFLSENELKSLKAHMALEDWKLVAFAVETALRREEQFRLRWNQVDMENDILTIPLPKGGRTRHVPLTEEARAILRSLDSFLRSPWVFPGLKDAMAPMDSRAFIRRAFEPALRKSGITGVSWHTLRHTAASRRIMAGVDLVSIKEFMGHRDIQTTMRYAHLSSTHLREAVNRGSLRGTGTKTGTKARGHQVSSTEVIDLSGAPGGT